MLDKEIHPNQQVHVGMLTPYSVMFVGMFVLFEQAFLSVALLHSQAVVLEQFWWNRLPTL